MSVGPSIRATVRSMVLAASGLVVCCLALSACGDPDFSFELQLSAEPDWGLQVYDGEAMIAPEIAHAGRTGIVFRTGRAYGSFDDARAPLLVHVSKDVGPLRPISFSVRDCDAAHATECGQVTGALLHWRLTGEGSREPTPTSLACFDDSGECTSVAWTTASSAD